MATFNFPNPVDTQTYTEAGITWTWNATLGVWSSDAGSVSGGANVEVGETAPGSPSAGDLWFCTAEAADGGGRLYIYYNDGVTSQWVDVSQPGAGIEYLSKTGDDTAQGAITFEGLTTHEAGVNVTGGSASDMSNGFVTSGGPAVEDTYLTIRGGGLGKAVLFRENVRFNATGATQNPSQAVVSSLNGPPAGATDHEFFAVRRHSDSNSSYETTKGFAVDNVSLKDPVENIADNTAYAFYTDLNIFNPDTANAYAFYSAGSASSYFAGTTFVGSVNASMANDVGVENGWVFAASGRAGSHVSLPASNDNISNLVLWRHNSNTGTFIGFRYTSAVGNGGDNLCGRIKGNGANAVNYEDTSDYRLKQNIQPLGTAVDLVKQLKPSTFEYISEPGVTYQGFVAHELQDICPLAVSGTKDETQVVGTLTDLDGNTEENVPEPTVVPAGSTFTATGTEELYQGVDQRRLIPLLTKALQEVIAENEDIKARLAALEGA